jgi:hypothetical protein
MKKLLIIVLLMSTICSVGYSQTESCVARIIIVEVGSTLPVSNTIDDGVICYIKANDQYYMNKKGVGWSLMNPTGGTGSIDTANVVLSKQNADENYTKLIDLRLSNARIPLTHSHSPAEITGTAIITNDSRLSDARTPTAHNQSWLTITSTPTTTTGYGLPAYPTTLPASDVYSWAKASTKPTYTYSEVEAAATSHTQAISTITGSQDSLNNKLNRGEATTLLATKQATLVSGTNIKTVNGNSLLGSGDIAISGSAAWGSITGTLSSQTDLNSALTGKEPANSNIQTHVTSAHAPSNAQKNSDITKAEIEAKLTGEISTHTHAGGSGGNGYCLNVQAASQATTTDAQTLYWGGMIVAPSTTANRWRVYIPKSGTIKAVYIYTYSGTAGTAEAWVMNIWKNNTTDTQIASVALAAVDRIWSNVALSISVVAGDYIEIKEVCPTWATNPATVTRTGQIYIE